MKQPPVEIPCHLRPIVGGAIRDRLQQLGAFVLCIAVSNQHVHTLAKLPKGLARDWSGAAKQHAWFEMRAHGWRTKLWGKRGKEVLVGNRQHQLNAFGYILAHAEQGAWVWRWEKLADYDQ